MKLKVRLPIPMRKQARAGVPALRQETQYTCMAASLSAALQALDKPVTEQDVNKVMKCGPMRGASWEDLLAAAQYFGMRSTLVIPATLGMLKEWTAAGTPVVIAWNPHGRPWSHASVVFDVDEDENVHIMDPNCPDPDTSVVVMPKKDFYSKWAEPMGDTMLIRRPAVAIEREITEDGRQVRASLRNPMDKKALDKSLALLEDEAGVDTDLEELQQLASSFSISTDETATRKRSVYLGAEDKRAREHGGLYGFTKQVQRDCDSAVGKLSKLARSLAKGAYTRDEKSASFLKTHVERSNSLSAQIILAAMEDIGPKFDKDASSMRVAARRLGLYGFPHKVSKIGLDACSEFRDEASKIALGLHQRRADQHDKITGYLGRHSSEAGCRCSSMILRHYPNEGQKLGSFVPQTMEDWLELEN